MSSCTSNVLVCSPYVCTCMYVKNFGSEMQFLVLWLGGRNGSATLAYARAALYRVLLCVHKHSPVGLQSTVCVRVCVCCDYFFCYNI